MNKAKHRNPRRELLSRYGRVVSWHVSLSVRADRPRGHPPRRESHTSIQLEGAFTEAVAGVAKFLIQVSLKDKPDLGNTAIPNIGAFISVKPEFQGVVDLTESEFQRLLTLATSDRLAWIFVAFTSPLRRCALITSIDFSTRAPDNET